MNQLPTQINRAISTYSRQSLTNLIHQIFWTRNCYIFSIGALFILFSWWFYILNFINYSDFTLIKLEKEDNSLWVIFYLIFLILLLIIWNIHWFIYTEIFHYTTSNQSTNNSEITSIAEELYQNPLFFIIILHHFNSSYLLNLIDFSFLLFTTLNYYFLRFYLFHYFSYFDKEILSITNFSSWKAKALLPKITLVSWWIFGVDVLFSLFIYILLDGLDRIFKFILIGNGIYIAIKVMEFYTSRKNEIRFWHYEVNWKEQMWVTKIKSKFMFESWTTSYIWFQYCIWYAYAQTEAPYYTVISLSLIISQAYYWYINWNQYKICKEYYWAWESSLEKTILDNGEECIICMERLKEARVLSCGHNFHFLCLSKWFEKGNKTCPVCRKEIKIFEDEKYKNFANRERIRNGFSLRWRLSNSMRNLIPQISVNMGRLQVRTVSSNIVIRGNPANNRSNNENNNQ